MYANKIKNYILRREMHYIFGRNSNESDAAAFKVPLLYGQTTKLLAYAVIAHKLAIIEDAVIPEADK